ncbi:unnamed protein product, partial [Dicrocoelium dendriticum]
ILLPDDFLESLEHQLSVITCTDESLLPLVFRWPERRLRICLVDSAQSQPKNSPTLPSHHSLLPKSAALNPPDSLRDRSEQASVPNGFGTHCLLPSSKAPTSRSANFVSVPEHPASASLFPYFSPGYIPTPAMLNALFSMAPGSHPPDFNPCQDPDKNPLGFHNTASHSGNSTSTFRGDNHYAPRESGASQYPPCDAVTYWTQLFAMFMQPRSATNTITSTPLSLLPTSTFNPAMYQQGLPLSIAPTNSDFIPSTAQPSIHPVSCTLARNC